MKKLLLCFIVILVVLSACGKKEEHKASDQLSESNTENSFFPENNLN